MNNAKKKTYPPPYKSNGNTVISQSLPDELYMDLQRESSPRGFTTVQQLIRVILTKWRNDNLGKSE